MVDVYTRIRGRYYNKQNNKTLSSATHRYLSTTRRLKAQLGEKAFVIIDNSPEREMLEGFGWEVAYDTMEIEI